MRLLVVDDEVAMADLVIDALSQRFDVHYAKDPGEARLELQRTGFDVVIVDLLYKDLSDEYDARRVERQISLLDDEHFLLSGLQTVVDTRQLGHRSEARTGVRTNPPGVLIYSNMDRNRALHVLYAYEELGVRAYCTKGVARTLNRNDRLENLVAAVAAAANGQPFRDIGTKSYMPRREAPKLRDALFAKQPWPAIWRALAMGIAEEIPIRSVIRRVGKASRLGNEFGNMRESLNALYPAIGASGGANLTALAMFASVHWEFFLDETVMRMFPPADHPWAREGATNAE